MLPGHGGARQAGPGGAAVPPARSVARRLSAAVCQGRGKRGLPALLLPGRRVPLAV